MLCGTCARKMAYPRKSSERRYARPFLSSFGLSTGSPLFLEKYRGKAFRLGQLSYFLDICGFSFWTAGAIPISEIADRRTYRQAMAAFPASARQHRAGGDHGQYGYWLSWNRRCCDGMAVLSTIDIHKLYCRRGMRAAGILWKGQPGYHKAKFRGTTISCDGADRPYRLFVLLLHTMDWLGCPDSAFLFERAWQSALVDSAFFGMRPLSFRFAWRAIYAYPLYRFP